MRYFIDYIVLCHQGNVRNKNQDNFWCEGKFLESDNDGLAVPLENCIDNTDTSLFAVFDGMGGEKYGEMAAYLAAKTFNSFLSGNPKIDTKKFLSDVCEKMNVEINIHIENNHTGHMGTTTAIITFNKKDIYICNVGDSKIFQYSTGKLTQISHDHVIAISNEKKPALTQHLGIPKTEFNITPYIAKGDYKTGDRYLICSDGLTDMVMNDEIEKMLTEQKNISHCANALMSTALSNGGVDNITIILCDIHKKIWGTPSKLRKDGNK